MTVPDKTGPLPTPGEGQVKGFASGTGATAGVVLMLLALQFVTGILISFYYVPSTAHAHSTVAFIEKVLPAGSWIRSLHHHGSQWLTLFLFLHIAQLFWRGAYRTQRANWLISIVLLALVLKAGGTGYSLPWDLRAFFSTRVAEALVGGLPLVGNTGRRWLLGGDEISTLTLSRFYAFHILVVPFLIVLVGGVRLLLGSATSDHPLPNSAGAFFTRQFARNTIAAALVFIALALYAKNVYAPLGPAATEMTSGYLPRPGAQFIWLYQLLKYAPGRLGSIVAAGLPAVILLGLAALSFFEFKFLSQITDRPRRLVGITLLSLTTVLVTGLTALAYISDQMDPRTRKQLLRQAAAETAFRADPFTPAPVVFESSVAGQDQNSSSGPPKSYLRLCATCHGQRGEGAQQGPLRFPQLLGVATKPRRTLSDIMALIDDPEAYGLEPPMKSFRGKLTEEEKRAIAEWIVSLK